MAPVRAGRTGRAGLAGLALLALLALRALRAGGALSVPVERNLVVRQLVVGETILIVPELLFTHEWILLASPPCAKAAGANTMKTANTPASATSRGPAVR